MKVVGEDVHTLDLGGLARTMNTETAVAVYAAGLSTTTALVAAARMLRDRPSIDVGASLTFRPAPADQTSAKGTLVERNEPGLFYECLLEIRVVNRGRRAIEVVGVIVEGMDEPNARITRCRNQTSSLPSGA